MARDSSKANHKKKGSHLASAHGTGLTQMWRIKSLQYGDASKLGSSVRNNTAIKMGNSMGA